MEQSPPTTSPEDTTQPESTIKILISTDNHLGYNENDAIRGKDSFRSFEEMLAIGGREGVDFVLLAGDLFHHNKPSRATMYRTMSILRTYCLGDGTINFQILSDQSLNFPNFGQVNYEDPNINVRLPIFSIHGNHDDPTGEAGRSLAALDLLSAANLSDRVDEIEVFPILLEKGSTKIAIYGLGNMRDERLHRMFAQGHVRFRRPEESPDSWFSIFVVHQNRDNRGRGAKNCLPESFIPEFIDFVVWGHEHECVIEAEESIKGDFYITQPGSSVATSLVEGEAKPKKIGLLEVRNNNFRLRSVPLKTVRPFKMAQVCLSDHKHLDPADPKVADKISAVLAGVMDYSLLIGMHYSQFKITSGHPPEDETNVFTRSGSPKLTHRTRLESSSATREEDDWSGENTFGEVTHRYSAHFVSGPSAYYIGIIDVLQQWTLTKQVERLYKVHVLQKDGRGISAINPNQYAKRFQMKMCQLLYQPDDEDD
ncbi:hypothetical protein DYB25_003404 [Aphanomyces astaci]|uniref:PIPK domain-containing protein n=1 Tax=Aphanomyces astaci TaxID=112090 RepID=A0A397B1W9_APHAT|nr:hypothetical protein DYB25_003404 [Aphanomyces astaci]